MPKNKPELLSVYLEPHVYNQVISLSVSEKRSMSNTAAWLIEKALDAFPADIKQKGIKK